MSILTWFRRECKHRLCYGMGLILLFNPCIASARDAQGMAQEVMVVTEDIYPLHYTVNNQLQGAGAELVERVLKETGLIFKVRVYPWARAYHIAKTQPNVIIYSLLRTPNREKRFKWIGEIIPLKYSLIRLKNRTAVAPKTLADLKQYEVGVLRNSAVHEYLQGKGNTRLTVIDSRQQNFKMLLDGRVDLVANNVVTLDFACEGLDIDCEQFEPIFELEEIATGLYMAFSQQTNDELVARVQSAYEKVRVQGDYDVIMKPILNPEKSVIKR